MRDLRTTITSVQPLAEHWLRVTFADGAVHEIDLANTLARGGVFAPIAADRAVFEAVSVDPECHTLVWPGEIDLDPYVLRGLYEPASGQPLPRRVIQLA